MPRASGLRIKSQIWQKRFWNGFQNQTSLYWWWVLIYYLNNNEGFFKISDLKIEDTGLYTCTASSESGETSWSASLSVENPKNPNIIFHKTPDPATFPPNPTKPKIVDRRATSVTISWRSSPSSGRSALIGYTIEYFSFDLETGWVVAAHRYVLFNEHFTPVKGQLIATVFKSADTAHLKASPKQQNNIECTVLADLKMFARNCLLTPVSITIAFYMKTSEYTVDSIFHFDQPLQLEEHFFPQSYCLIIFKHCFLNY